MTSVNAAGMDVIGDSNPNGSTLGKTTSDKVGSHGSAAAQATVGGAGALDAVLAALNDKGIINYTGSASTLSLGSPLVVFDPDEFEITEGDGEIVVGVGTGGDFSGTIRSDGLMTFIVNGDDSSNVSQYRWREGGQTAGTSDLMMTLKDGNLNMIGSIAAEGVVTGGAGGANAGAAESVSVLGVSEVTLAPTGGGTRHYNFTNKVDGQQLFIRLTGTDDVSIDGSATTSIYMNQPTESNAVVRWNATTSRWVGTKGLTISS